MLKELLIMPSWGIGLMFFGAFLLFAFAHYISKSRHPFKRSLLSMAIGILTLIAVNLTGSFTGVYLPVSLMLCRIWRSARSNADAWTEFIFLNQFLFVLFLSKSLAKSISKAFFCIKGFYNI